MNDQVPTPDVGTLPVKIVEFPQIVEIGPAVAGVGGDTLVTDTNDTDGGHPFDGVIVHENE